MKGLIILLLVLMLPCQAALFDGKDPFAIELITPEHFYRSESLQGLHGVKEWKREQMRDALESEPYTPPAVIPRTCHASAKVRHVFFL